MFVAENSVTCRKHPSTAKGSPPKPTNTNDEEERMKLDGERHSIIELPHPKDPVPSKLFLNKTPK